MVYRKVDWDSLDETKEQRRKRQRREGMKRAYDKDPDKFRERALDYYSANKEEISPKRKTYRQLYDSANPEKKILATVKSRAKRKGLEFNIDVTDIIIPEFCPILGVKLVKGDGIIHRYSPSLDRINNSKGYIKGNVAVISQTANSIKKELSLDEIEKLYFYMKGITYNS